MIDYDLNEQLADREDLDQLKNMGINLKLDFILNHASAQSPQFRDLVEKGEASAYRDFFIDWNHFWEGHGRQYLGQMDVNIQSPKVWEFYREKEDLHGQHARLSRRHPASGFKGTASKRGDPVVN